MKRILAVTLVAGAVVAMAQAASAQEYWGPGSVASPPPPPPALREEVVPVAPGPPESAVWVRGHYEWGARGYYWVNGYYLERPEVGLIWEPGRWVARYGRWEWIAGHWRR